MKILQISDTHNLHQRLTYLPTADVIVHCGDFTDQGTEKEVLDFLNWFIDLPYREKIFITGNHALCLWEAESIEDLPSNMHFLQDCGCCIDGVHFWGLSYNHDENLIPDKVDVLVTHEPPIKILDKSNGINWGNASLKDRILQIKPHYHLFGHAHESHGIIQEAGIVFANGAMLDDQYNIYQNLNIIEYQQLYW